LRDPIISFDNSNIPDFVVKELRRAGFTKPTSIQSIAWPTAISGMDLIAIASTGSGKTLGFLIPMFVHINDQPPIRVK
jgi:ATP-dependent RNA helicase DDX5/DBP2